MTLCKHRNGIYYIWWTDELGRRHKTSTRSRRKAEALKFLQRFKAGRQERRAGSRYRSVSQFLEEYLEYSRTYHAPATQSLASLAFRQFIRVVGDLPIQKISTRQIDTFLSVRPSEASVWTARKYYGVLASAFEIAVRWKYIASNPFREIGKPKAKEALPAHFSKAEFTRFITDVTDLDDRDLYVCAILTGLRLSELACLEWSSDIDFVRTLVLAQNKVNFSTKTRRNRAIPMNEQLWRLLASRKEKAVCDLVFHREGRRLSKDAISKTFKRYIRELGFDDRLHFHSLRHTFATWLVQEGVSLYEVQKLLGHSSVTVTQVYAHLGSSELQSAVDRIVFSLN